MQEKNYVMYCIMKWLFHFQYPNINALANLTKENKFRLICLASIILDADNI